MSTFTFQKATKQQSRLRLALIGPSGSGKTYTALNIARNLGEKIALIDTEHGSASKYAGDPFVFDTLDLETFEPLTYVAAIGAAEEAGYDVLVIDSLSHAWSGKGGALEQVDNRSGAGGKFGGWREVTPMHNQLIDAIVGARLHVIATMRSKTEYAVEQDGGKTKVLKLGLAPVQRDGMEYEFDVVGDIDQQHVLRVTKTRCAALDDAVIAKPGEQIAETLKTWLSDGETAAEIEKPAAKDRKRFEKVIADLGKADESHDWADIAEKAAVRDFKHGVGALSKTELDTLATAMESHLETLKAAKGNGSGDEEKAKQAVGAEA